MIPETILHNLCDLINIEDHIDLVCILYIIMERLLYFGMYQQLKNKRFRRRNTLK